jgi:hypothetical protein
MKESFHSTIENQFKRNDFLFEERIKIILPPKPSQKMVIFQNNLPDKITINSFNNHSLLCINAWLSQDGILHPCKWRQHSEGIVIAGYKTDFEIESKGWIKLSQMKWLTKRYNVFKPTHKQLKTIKNWHQSNDLSMEYYETTR